MEKTFSGKTVEEAVATGLKELELSREDVEVEVIEEGKKGLFKSIPAQVKLTVKEKLTDGQRAVKFLEGLLPLVGANASPTLLSEDEKIVIQLQTEEGTKGIIGRRGEIIDAVQVLAGAVANTGRRDYRRVVVDCANYREEREETLKRVAEKLAAKAVRQRKSPTASSSSRPRTSGRTRKSPRRATARRATAAKETTNTAASGRRCMSTGSSPQRRRPNPQARASAAT